MNAAAQSSAKKNYNDATDCLLSLYDATVKLTNRLARGLKLGASERWEVKGMTKTVRMLADAAGVYVAGSYSGEPDARRADRAILRLNEELLKGISCILRSTKDPDRAELLLRDAFDEDSVRSLYTLVTVFAASINVASGWRPSDAYNRGFEDADKERPCLFYRRGGEFWTHSDDPGADDWSQEARADYMRGYEDSEAADGIR